MARGKSGIYIATGSGTCDVDGVPINFIQNVTLVREGHPLLKVAGHFFEPVENHVHYDVEAATAAPGEKRTRVKAAAE